MSSRVHGPSRSWQVALTSLMLLGTTALGAQEPRGSTSNGGTPDSLLGPGFVLDLGADLSARPRPRGRDFEVYDVVRRADPRAVLFSVYIGDYPEVGTLEDGEPWTAGLAGRSRTRRTADGRASRDVLVLLPNEPPHPTRLHIWYTGAAAADAARADQAIATLRRRTR